MPITEFTVRLNEAQTELLESYRTRHLLKRPLDAIRHLVESLGNAANVPQTVPQPIPQIAASVPQIAASESGAKGDKSEMPQMDSAVIQGILARLEVCEKRMIKEETVMKWNQATQDAKAARNLSRELRNAMEDGKWDTTFLEAPVLEGGFPGIKARLKALEERVEGELGALAMERRVEAALQRPMKEAAAWIQEEVMYLKQAIKMTKSRLKLLEHHTLGLPLVDPEPVEGSEVAAGREVPVAAASETVDAEAAVAPVKEGVEAE